MTAWTPGPSAGDPRPDPVIEIYKRGIDRTLLQQNLTRTPEERVLALMALQSLAREAREAGVRVGAAT